MQNEQQIKTEKQIHNTVLTYINNHTEKRGHKTYKSRMQHYIQNYKQNRTHTQTAKKIDLSGIYKLNSSECNKFYIGQTRRSFQQRYTEHNRITLYQMCIRDRTYIIQITHTKHQR